MAGVVFSGIINFFIAWTVFSVFFKGAGGFWIALIGTVGAVALGVSQAGEKILVDVLRARTLRPEEASLLTSPLEEVCGVTQSQIPNLLIADDESVNAFAVGSNMAVVTAGLLQAPPEMIAGVLAHEMGHIRLGHSRLLAAHYMASWMSFIATWIVSFFTRLSLALTQLEGTAGFVALIFGLVLWFFNLVFRALAWVGSLAFMAGSRSQEFDADRFAAQAGYGPALIAFLQAVEGGPRPQSGFLATLMDTHPPAPARIAAIGQAMGVGASQS